MIKSPSPFGRELFWKKTKTQNKSAHTQLIWITIGFTVIPFAPRVLMGERCKVAESLPCSMVLCLKFRQIVFAHKIESYDVKFEQIRNFTLENAS